MHDAISNSIPLILLAKIGHTYYLFSVFERIIIPLAVFDEVIKKGLEQGYPDAIELEDLYQKELIVFKKPKIIDKRLEKVKS